MGYSTDFDGSLNVSPALPEHLNTFFKKFNETRRMARKVDPMFGIQGEFFVDGSGSFGQGRDSNIIDSNTPPKTQPGLWCQWLVQDDSIKWDGGEKFYYYEKWLYYLINRLLKPLGHTVNGTITWSGEDSGDIGSLIVKDNVLYVFEGVHIEDEEEFEFYMKKGKGSVYSNEYTKMVDSLPAPEIQNILPKEKETLQLPENKKKRWTVTYEQNGGEYTGIIAITCENLVIKKEDPASTLGKKLVADGIEIELDEWILSIEEIK